MIEQLVQPRTEIGPNLWGPFSVAGRNALVTGGAKGIGHGIANRLAEGGANVVVADVDEQAAERAAAQLGDMPGRAVACRLDVSQEPVCREAIARCVEQFGSLDILVNNAGIFPTSAVLDMTPEFFEHLLAVNLKGVFYMSKAAGVQMRKQGTGGKIINIASVDSVHPSFPGLAAYDASKGGVLSFTKNFALEMAPYNVTVNAIAPGGITTEGTAQPLTGMSAEQMEAMTSAFLQRIPLKRMGVPDDIAKVAVFLASSAADYMTGTFVVVDGGMLLA
ncbi:MAG: SDR family oxidoreductase [Candidatus Dormibacteraeota bacterium]|nr:SDR family oxidoreductase [Candidatus Dormibacteraeota bacterium]